ncbi:MAG: hypothetical protein IPL86_17425 [Flavobacteriales bacterium]|jgi:hypothetical protein|nr:hypothetical protein [Flavobacteriales bacterium]
MLRITSLAFLFAFAIGSYAQGQTCTSTIESVEQQVGETVVFCGTPSQVRASGKDGSGPVYLNFGGNYPDNVFSVVIFSDVAGTDRDALLKQFTGKKVRVKGTVKEHNGKAEIILRSLADIEVE